MDDWSDQALVYLERAEESLAGAESELRLRRFNNCANRCYYAAFQAAVAALLANQLPIHNARGKLNHAKVQADFARQLVHSRSRYPRDFRRILPDLLIGRQAADYEIHPVTELEAHRMIRLTRSFVETIVHIEGVT